MLLYQIVTLSGLRVDDVTLGFILINLAIAGAVGILYGKVWDQQIRIGRGKRCLSHLTQSNPFLHIHSPIGILTFNTTFDAAIVLICLNTNINLCVQGVPAIVTQAYLVNISICIAYQFSFLPQVGLSIARYFGASAATFPWACLVVCVI